MNTIQFLQSYSENQRAADRSQDEINTAQAALDRLSEQKPEPALLEIQAGLKKQYKAIIKENAAKRKKHLKACSKIADAVAALEDPTEKELLAMRYLQIRPPTWEKIAEKLNYSLGNVYAIHRKAIKHLEEIRPK